MTDQERERLEHLRSREADGDALTGAEQAELSAFLRRIEEEEAAYLRPANERLRAEIQAQEERNRSLRALIERRQALVARLETVVTELEDERRAIDEDVARILGGGPLPKAGAGA